MHLHVSIHCAGFHQFALSPKLSGITVKANFATPLISM